MKQSVQAGRVFGEPGRVDASLLTEELPALLAFIDADGRYGYVNRACEAFFGRSRDDILGRRVSEIAGHEHFSRAQEYMQRALAGQSVTFASALTHADGATRDVEVSYAPHVGEGGRVTGFISLIRDVTERTSLAETRARLAAIIDSSDDAIVSKTLEGIITSWNRSAEKIFGYTAAEAIGQHITLIIPPERKAEEDEVLARLRRGDKIDHFETQRVAKDGRIVEISLSVAPVRNGAGEVIGAAKVARDITERKRHEQALRAVEEYRRAVLQSMPDCVKVLDGSGVVLHMNPAGVAMMEADSPDQIIGKSVYSLVSEADRDAFRAVNENVFSGGPGGRLQFGIRGLKGSERIFEANVVPLRGGAGEVIGALSVTRDITNRKRSELRDAFLVRLDDTTRRLSDPREIMRSTSRLLAEHLGADRCAYADVDPAAGRFDVSGDYSRDLPSIVGQYSLASFGELLDERLASGEPYVIDDVASQLTSPATAEAFRALQISAVVTVPLVKAGQLVAGLAVHQAKPRKWRQHEVELVRLVANRCWESIERTRVERELRESEQQFRTLANTIPNLAWMAHREGHIFWYNRRWYEYTGTTREEMEGWGWQSVHDPDVLPEVVDKWKYSIATGEPFEMIFPLKGADGMFRQFLTRVEPITDDFGKVARWFGTNTDVTSQQEARRREKRARDTAEALNRIGPVLAAELDPEKLTQTITDIATAAVGAQVGAFFHSVANEAGESYDLYTLSGAPREAFAHLPMPRNTLVFGPTFRGEAAVRSDDITKDHRYGRNPPYHGMPEGHFPVRSYLAVPVRSRTGAVIGGLFFGHGQPGMFTAEAEDIATGIAGQAAIALDNASLFKETQRSAEALRRSNEELRRLNEDLNQFAYSASHDLREPLRMVSIYTQFLGRKLKGQLDAESERFIEHVLKGASRLEALIRDLLAYTKAANSPDPEYASTDANDALAGALADLSATIEETGAVVRVSGPRLPRVPLAEVHITQLLQNLIGNAIKYRSHRTPEITVSAARRGGEWEFSVKDNGIGIEERYREQIFGIFKRLHNTDEYSGTGIGLAICQRIVQRYGGRIWVESEAGRGSTFFFTVPAAG